MPISLKRGIHFAQPTPTYSAVHRIAALLKRWWLGTLHGAVSPDHFSRYLEEYVFRFNRRTFTHRRLLFYRVRERAVQAPLVPYKDVIGG